MSNELFKNFSDWNTKNPVGTSSVKIRNRGIVLSQLVSEKRLSRAELARRTKLSAPTISRIIAELIASGIVYEEGIRQTGEIGAPASMLLFNHSVGYVIGVDIGESVIQAALSDLGAAAMDIMTAPTKARIGGDVTTEQVAGICRQLVQRNGLTMDQVWFICVGVPATVLVDEKENVLVNAPDIQGWSRYPLKTRLTAMTGVSHIFVENAQNLAVICEHTVGCAVDYSDVVFIQVKGGIGAGILLNGELFRGSGGVAGEIGFTMPAVQCSVHENRDSSARHGALEMEIGIPALLKKLEGIPEYAGSAEEVPDLEALYQRAADGDAYLRRIICETWDYLGMTAVNISAVLNPQIIVLGGDIFPLAEQVRDRVRTYVQTYCLRPPIVELSTQGNKTCLFGSVQMACSRVLRKLGVC